MKEISDGLFEYLFNKTVREKKALTDYVNKRDNKITVLYLKDKEYCFLISGNVETDYYGRYKENGANSNLIYIRPLKSDKIYPIARTEILRIEEEITIEDFLKEAQGLYVEIMKKQGADEPEKLRLDHRRHFAEILEEAAQMELEMSRRRNEDIWAYARRLSNDERSAEKSKAIKLIRQTDEEISELWKRLRYETDMKRRVLTEKVIDRMILGCLDEIEKNVR